MRKKLLYIALLAGVFSGMQAQEWKPERPALYACGQLVQQPEALSLPTVGYQLQDNERCLGYVPQDEPILGIGTKGPASYGAAIRIAPAAAQSMKNNQVTLIRVGLYGGSHVTNGKVWIRESANGKNVVEQSCDFTKAGSPGWTEVRLDTPYTIQGGEFFIGYSFDLNAVQDDFDKFPIGVSEDKSAVHPDGIYMKLNDSALTNFADKGFANLTLQAVCEGQFTATDIDLSSARSPIYLKNQEGSVRMQLTNVGSDPVDNVDLEYTFDGQTQTQHIELNSLPMLGITDLEIAIQAPQEAGHVPFTATVVKVNGKDDQNMDNNTGSGIVPVYSQQAQHKVAFEEATGLWCGFCPRGHAAIERIHKELSDKAVCISVHIDDRLAADSYEALRNYVPGYPCAIIDRALACDPYFGASENPFGIADVINLVASVYAPADIAIHGAVNGNKLDLTSEFIFYTTSDECPYKVGYVLTEDKLKGNQKNYYSGAEGQPEDLQKYCDAKGMIKDMEMNDVALLIDGFQGIAGSLEGALVDQQTKTHHYTMDLSSLSNIHNGNVVVLLFDGRGRIVNANTVRIDDIQPAGIDATAAEAFAPEISVAYGILNIAGEGALEAEVYTPSGVQVARYSFEDHLSVALNGLQGLHLVRVHNGNDVKVMKAIF